MDSSCLILAYASELVSFQFSSRYWLFGEENLVIIIMRCKYTKVHLNSNVFKSRARGSTLAKVKIQLVNVKTNHLRGKMQDAFIGKSRWLENFQS